MAEVAEHQRVAEATVITAAAPNHREIRLGQRVIADQITPLPGRFEQRGDLGLGQLLSAHRSCSPEASHRQTTRSDVPPATTGGPLSATLEIQ